MGVSDRSALRGGVAHLSSRSNERQVTFPVEYHQVTFSVSASVPRPLVPNPILVVCEASDGLRDQVLCLSRSRLEWEVAGHLQWRPGRLGAEGADRFGWEICDVMYQTLAARYGFQELLTRSPD